MINDTLNRLMDVPAGYKPSTVQKMRRAESLLDLFRTELPEDKFRSFINISQPNVVMHSMPQNQAYIVSTPLSKNVLVQVVLRGIADTFDREEIVSYLDQEIPRSNRLFKFRKMGNHIKGKDCISILMNCDDRDAPAVLESVMTTLEPLLH